MSEHHSCQYRMAAHGGKPKIRHKVMADGMAGYGGSHGGLKIYKYIYKKYPKKTAKHNK